MNLVDVNIKKIRSAMKMRGSKQDQSLPWWVELLFVQIGLPDNWLRKILKSKKTVKAFIRDNNKQIKLTILTTFFLIYFYPLIRAASINNECVINSLDYIEDKIGSDALLSDKELKAYATNFCNGGKL